jgi:hypothetical protein
VSFNWKKERWKEGKDGEKEGKTQAIHISEIKIIPGRGSVPKVRVCLVN